MLKYDPEKAPKPAVWLAADEQERIDACLRWHQKARVELPNELLHAAMHAAVENQLAEKLPSVVRAIPRLMQACVDTTPFMPWPQRLPTTSSRCNAVRSDQPTRPPPKLSTTQPSTA